MALVAAGLRCASVSVFFFCSLLHVPHVPRIPLVPRIPRRRLLRLLNGQDDPRLPLDGKGARKAHRRKLSATLPAPDLKDEALFPDIDFAASVGVLQPRRGALPSGTSTAVSLISEGDPAEAEEEDEDAQADTRVSSGSIPRGSRARIEEAQVISGR